MSYTLYKMPAFDVFFRFFAPAKYDIIIRNREGVHIEKAWFSGVFYIGRDNYADVCAC